MEAFSLLRYWKNGGGATLRAAGDPSPTASVSSPAMHSGNDEPDNDNDLFDLEFTVPEDDDDVDDSEDGRCESVSFSLPDTEDSDEGFTDGNLDASKLSLSNLPAPPLSLLNKSATKFRVFFLGFKKAKAEPCVPPKNGKFFTVKFNVEETPIASLFAKDMKASKKPDAPDTDGANVSASEDKNRVPKEGVQRYLKKVKPLYVKVSKREKPRSSGGLERETKKLSSKTAAIVLPAAVCGGGASNRRDDSLLQQQDGIQGAILHCKRSFNASPDSGEKETESGTCK